MLRLLCVLSLSGCLTAQRSTPLPVLPPDPAATLAYGERGPFAVASTHWNAQARVSESIAVEARFPPDAAGPLPVFLFVQGGLVGVERYTWLLDHLASRGVVAVAASHLFELPFFEVDNPAIAYESALDRLRDHIDVTSPVIVGGHSLGGVTSAWLFASHPTWQGLVFFASYAADANVNQSQRPVLSIGGANDRKAKPAQVKAGFAHYGDPRALFFVPGMNHYAWTDHASANELASDGVLEGDLDAVRKQALRVLDAWMDATLSDTPEAHAALAEILANEGVSL